MLKNMALSVHNYSKLKSRRHPFCCAVGAERWRPRRVATLRLVRLSIRLSMQIFCARVSFNRIFKCAAWSYILVRTGRNMEHFHSPDKHTRLSCSDLDGWEVIE
ncbi:hypothetical protein AB6A40_003579 [Gnathostoma spinigerum]|uniref:Uncharacterized protein n=1 Tax=Gnathostoma spinigerum TaxID=75299 RepID=A0ABD6EB51_9BILA